MSEYPKWKYAEGKSITVMDGDAEKSLGSGWYDTPTLLAKSLEVPAVSEEVSDEKLALLAKAATLGIKADKRWGIEKLREAVAGRQKVTDYSEKGNEYENR